MLTKLQIEGLVGPTHHYAGLGQGNVASETHAASASNPRQAALQSLEKMRRLHEMGVAVMVMPPQLRPKLSVLDRLGISANAGEQLQQANALSPTLLHAIWSASSMWTANAATVTPASDSRTGLLQLTPANLLSSLHRVIEADETAHYLAQHFSPLEFVLHPKLPVTTRLADEGAANHMRLSNPSGGETLHLYTYGAAPPNSPFPTWRMPRQQRAASEAIIEQHQIHTPTLCLQQHPDAIDAGVFHHDVIGMSHHHYLIVHERAWWDQEAALAQIRSLAPWAQIRVISEAEFSLQDAVASYFFNAQIVSFPEQNGLAILFPEECQHHACVHPVCEGLADFIPELKQIAYVPLKESMRNGGGPACLRLRVPLTQQDIATLKSAGNAFFTTRLHQRLQSLITSHYRDHVTLDDLLDAEFAIEAQQTQQAILQLLGFSSQQPTDI